MKKWVLLRYFRCFAVWQISTFVFWAVFYVSIASAQNNFYELPKPIFVSQDSRDGLLRLANRDLKGWDYLFNLFLEEGVNPLYVANVIADSRMPRYEVIYFSARPKEPKHIYKKVNTNKARSHAMTFFNEHKQYFMSAERIYNVPASVILAILQVESHCGEFTGKQRVFYRLARLVSASDPNSLQENLKYNRKFFKDVTMEEVQKRALWLKETFLSHLIATVLLADQQGVHPLEVRGSSGGGLGMPQFLPGNITRYGVDADGDRVVMLGRPGDAILSVAKFLKSNGWTRFSLSKQEKKKVILAYNKSIHYADTVLSMADQLRASMIRNTWQLSKPR